MINIGSAFRLDIFSSSAVSLIFHQVIFQISSYLVSPMKVNHS